MQGTPHQRFFTGTGADDDIVVSSVRAYIAALNKLVKHVSQEEKRAVEAEAHQASEKSENNLVIVWENALTDSKSGLQFHCYV